MKVYGRINIEFIYFLRHFFRYLLCARGVLSVIFLLIFLLGAIFSLIEGIKFGDAIYFSLITGLGVGYGDITPHTFIGQVISICIGLTGLMFFGIIVGISNLSIKKAAEFYFKNKRG